MSKVQAVNTEESYEDFLDSTEHTADLDGQGNEYSSLEDTNNSTKPGAGKRGKYAKPRKRTKATGVLDMLEPDDVALMQAAVALRHYESIEHFIVNAVEYYIK